MKKFRILKLIALTIGTMITLVAISFIEVAIYSLFVPGQDQAFYEAHAKVTAPWVSAVGGFFVFFFMIRYWAKRKFEDLLKLAILYPVTYVVLDVLILLSADLEWNSFIFIFLLANGSKFLGSLGSYYIFSRSTE